MDLNEAGKATSATFVAKNALLPIDWMPLPKSTVESDVAPQNADAPRVFNEFGSTT